ncbi:hypothetical protein ACFXA4_25475 [Streptomyces sp. NPDC059442]|uniref:hypothetical protein n=1 Tax=Streptomyces sp. NPDC059442 TaxID=3346830 RepID=UPI0036D0905C
MRGLPDLRGITHLCHPPVLGAAQQTSSRILDMTGLKGTVTKPGPLRLHCDDYEPEGRVVRMRHTWSVYDLPYEELEKGYAHLRTALTEDGWRIVSDGPNTSKAKTPTMVVESPDGDYSADVRLMDRRAAKDPTSLIYVTVVSRCFQETPGASPAP